MSIFDHAHQKTIESTFSFPESVPTYKNQFIPLVYFGDRANFIVPWPDLPHLFFFDHAHPKNVWSASNFCESGSTCKKSVILSVHSSDSQFWSPLTRLATPRFDQALPKNFQSSFNLHEFVPACKKSVNSICSFLRYSQF